MTFSPLKENKKHFSWQLLSCTDAQKATQSHKLRRNAFYGGDSV